MTEQKFSIKLRSVIILLTFSLSIFVFISPLIIEPVNESEMFFQSPQDSQSTIISTENNRILNSIDKMESTLDNVLLEWINSGITPDSNYYRRNNHDQVVISVFASKSADFNAINQNMVIDSFLDLGDMGYIVLGAISNPRNLKNLVESSPFLKINSDPYYTIFDDFEAENGIHTITDGFFNPDQFVGNEEMSINQAHLMDCGGLSCDGTGVTIAIVDGGIDFGNSDLESALALDAQGLPKSFDTEGWSLVSTPLTVGIDIPVTANDSILLFSEVDEKTLTKLKINDPGNIELGDLPKLNESRGWDYWHQNAQFMKPQNWIINSSWINNGIQAPPKFGVGVQHYLDIITDDFSWGYFYTLLLDINFDGEYDSVVIDMESSAWTTYLNYVGSLGGDRTPISEIYPDFDFTNNKIVSWLTNTDRNRTSEGKDYTFAVDWNNDGANDWSFGSMANAYNRYGFLAVNESLYGKFINGVDPNGAGFVALYPYGFGFSSHGTWTASMAGSRGKVDYQVFTNRTNSVNFPYGNISTRKIPGTAPGADIMSVTFGASPQDEMIGWFWAAGMDLDTTSSLKTANISGAQWKWSGSVRANITSNSWGIGGLYWSGLWGTDWLSDLLSLPNFGGGSTYNKKLQDFWAGQALKGTSNEQNLENIDFKTHFQPFKDFSIANTFYIGGNNPFIGVGLNISNPASSGFSANIQYYSGSQWETIPNDTIQWDFQGLSWTRFSLPVDWELTNFSNNGNEFYWFRFTVTESSDVNISSIWLELPNPFYGFPGLLMVTSAGNNYYFDSTANPFGSLSLKVGASSSGHTLANQYGPNWNETNFQMAFFSSAGPKSNGVPGVDVVAPGYYVYSVAPLARSLQGGNSGPGDIVKYGGDGNFSFVRWAGTSASAPAAAGVSAIAYQAYMNEHQGEFVNPNIIKQILKSTTTNLFYPSNIQGTGLINASSTVEFIQNPDTSKYFLTGSNITFEEQLKSSGWLATLGDFFWYYVYSNRDSYANLIDFPVTFESILSSNHYDVDLSTKSVTKGDIVTTQVAIKNNGTGDVSVSGHNTTLTGFDSKTVVIDNKDQFQGMTGDYQINISIADLIGWESDFIKIKVTNLDVIDNASFFVWEDFDGDGYLEMSNYTMPETNGKGELARVQYDSTIERSFGILKIGNPARFNTGNLIPFIVLRGNPDLVDVYDSNWASGMIFEVFLRSYNLYNDWSSVVTSTPWKIENGVSIWNISLDTSGLQAGFHFGYLKFTDLITNHSQLMSISLKVANGEIDQSDPTTNPEAIPTYIGDFTLSRAGKNSEITFQDGSMVWVPFTVDESKTKGEKVLVIRVTQLSAGDANFGYVLHYDETPEVFDSSWMPILVSPNITGQVQGKNVNWQYVQWGSVGFGSDTFIARNGYYRFGAIADQPLIRYKLGIFSTKMEDELDLRLEMYWLPQMPKLSARVQSDDSLFEYCQISEGNYCFYKTQILYGPDAELNITSICDFCDPNLPPPSILSNQVESIPQISSGSFQYGFDPDISIDWWEKRFFQTGDLVEFTVSPTEPVTDLNLFIFSPSTLKRYNLSSLQSLPLNDTGVILASDFFLDYATGFIGEIGSFVAEESGEYWFGIDNYGFNSADWIVFTRISRGQIKNYQTSSVVINTQIDSEFALDVEATYDSITNTYDKTTSLVVGVNTPTNLDLGLYSFDLNIDNLVAPFAFLGESSKKLNETIINREIESVIIDWEGFDLNGDDMNFIILLVGPNTDEVYVNTLSTNSANWNFSDQNFYSDGWWTFYIWANDSIDPSNTIDGINYGGLGLSATFRVFLRTSTFIETTIIESRNVTISPSLLELFGWIALGAIGGVTIISLGALTYLRRVEIGNKISEIHVKVREQLEKRQSKEE